jgi:hypothetical protein
MNFILNNIKNFLVYELNPDALAETLALTPASEWVLLFEKECKSAILNLSSRRYQMSEADYLRHVQMNYADTLKLIACLRTYDQERLNNQRLVQDQAALKDKAMVKDEAMLKDQITLKDQATIEDQAMLIDLAALKDLRTIDQEERKNFQDATLQLYPQLTHLYPQLTLKIHVVLREMECLYSNCQEPARLLTNYDLAFELEDIRQQSLVLKAKLKSQEVDPALQKILNDHCDRILALTRCSYQDLSYTKELLEELLRILALPGAKDATLMKAQGTDGLGAQRSASLGSANLADNSEMLKGSLQLSKESAMLASNAAKLRKDSASLKTPNFGMPRGQDSTMLMREGLIRMNFNKAVFYDYCKAQMLAMVDQEEQQEQRCSVLRFQRKEIQSLLSRTTPGLHPAAETLKTSLLATLEAELDFSEAEISRNTIGTRLGSAELQSSASGFPELLSNGMGGSESAFQLLKLKLNTNIHMFGLIIQLLHQRGVFITDKTGMMGTLRFFTRHFSTVGQDNLSLDSLQKRASEKNTVEAAGLLVILEDLIVTLKRDYLN